MLYTRQMACGTSFLSRQRDVIASFSFGACCMYTNFFTEMENFIFTHFIYRILFESYLNFVLGVYRTFLVNFGIVIRSLCLLQARNTGAADISWQVLTAIVSVHAAERKVKVQILVSHIMIALLVTPSLKINASNCPRLVIGLKKRDLKKSSDTPAKDSSSSSLIDPSCVMVVGAVDAQGVIQSPGSSSDKKKKPNPPEKKPSNQNPKSGKEKPSKSPTPQSHRSSSDTRIDELDLKWSERFNRLEALLLAKSLDKPEPTFAPVKVTPTHSPPVGVVKSSEPFIRLADRSQHSDLSSTDHSPQRQSTDKSLTLSSKKQTSDLPGVTQIARKSQSTSKLPKDKPLTGQPTDLTGTGSPAHLQVSSKSTSAPAGRQSSASMDTDSDSDFSDQPAVDIFVEEGELSDPDQDAATNDPDQILSEDQNYRETMRGIRSYMGWTHIPDMDTAISTSDDNPFAGPKTQPTGKVSVNMPVDEWLCKKMGKLNLTLVEGYPSRSSEAGGLLKDQFVLNRSGMVSLMINRSVLLLRLCLLGIRMLLR